MPSSSVSRLQPSVPIVFSTVSGMRSLSSSVSTALRVPSPSQSSLVAVPPIALGPIMGESLEDVYVRPKRAARTRRRKRVACGLDCFCSRNGRSLAGTVSVSRVVVAEAALTKTARLPSRLKTTVLRFLPLR